MSPLIDDAFSGRGLAVLGRRTLLPLMIATAMASPVQAADLLTITRDALANNATLASARSSYSGVESGRDVERGDLLPQLNASAEAANNRTYNGQTGSSQGTGTGSSAGVEDDYNSVSASLEATQALFDATAWHELERAEEEIEQQAHSLEATRQQLLYDVAAAYFDILRAHDILEAREAQETAIERQLEQAREQFDVGLIAITDVDEAEASYDQARADRIAAENDLQVSFEALERLTGQRYNTIDGLGDELPIESPQPGNRDDWVELAMEHNPSLLMAEAGVDVARSVVDVSQAGRLPTLEAFASYQYSDTDSEFQQEYNSSGQFGVRASMPLYTGGTTSAGIEQSTYELESTQYDAEAQRRDTIQQVRSLFTQVSNDVESVEARRQAIESNESALEATRSGYEVGTRNIVDVLNAEQNLYDAIANHAEARYDYVIDLLELRQQSGILDTNAVRSVNEWLRNEDQVSLALPNESANGSSRYDDAMDIGAPPEQPAN
ncbi:TolC family outer membrane protein [Aidingimonas lacisalsi]|uniref:TolC family outer membrane protein n=1 Tax=Aidingimonas lacisalsi TaxID=2604086 RepID=UPI001F022EA0|nr:TolC family outer membrane protein [Aidingimonas lacisalsi]